VVGGVGAVLIVRGVGRLLLRPRLLDLQRRLFLLVLGDAPLAVELVDLRLHGALLAAGDLQVVLGREDVLLFARGDRVDRRVVDLVLEPAAAACDPNHAEQYEWRDLGHAKSHEGSEGQLFGGHDPPIVGPPRPSRQGRRGSL
jgi:hypothetical protein